MYEYTLFLNRSGYYQTDIYKVENGRRTWVTQDFWFTRWGAKRGAEKEIRRLLGPPQKVETYTYPPREQK